MKHFEDMKQFLYKYKTLIQELKDKKIDACFDIGFTIDTPDYVARYIQIDKELLFEMAKLEVGLSLSSYLSEEND